ncbi:hypothetical protein JCM11491_005445 [Sporobolomyces phaffii]
MAPPSTGAAKTAAGGSSVRGRTKHEQDQLQRKTVYRPVLDNPLTVAWPPLPASVRRSILDHLLPILTAPQGTHGKSVADWRAEEHAARRGRVPNKGKGKGKGKDHAEAVPRDDAETTRANADRAEAEDNPMEDPRNEEEPQTEKSKTSTRSRKVKPAKSPVFHPSSSSKETARRVPLSRPPVLDYLCLGINEVTKALETRIRWGRWELGDRNAMPGASQLVEPAPTGAPVLLPTAADDDDHFEPATAGRKRIRKKSHPTSFSPHTSLKLDSIDYSSFPGYAFVATPPSRPTRESKPPYFLASTAENPSPRLLVNSETLRIKRAVKKEGVPQVSQRKRREAGGRTTGKVERKPHESSRDETDHDVSMTAEKGDVESTNLSEIADAEEEDGEEDTREELPPTVPVIDLVFVCKPDINPPSLVAHLPGMVAAANGVQVALETVLETKSAKGAKEGMEVDPEDPSDEEAKRPKFEKVKIVPLDQGAERVLADALGVRRVAAIGVSSALPGIKELLALVEKHAPPPLAPWLTPHLLHPPPHSSAPRSQPPSTYVETHIKHLKTSAPFNPKAKNMEKKAKRKADKEERRQKKKAKKANGEVYEAQDDEEGNHSE